MATSEISIHAPARGATYLRAPVYHFHSNFNPRSREGSDIFYGVPAFRGVLFQSTLPRGERRHIGVNVLFHDLFQSTLPRGERPREIHPHQSEHNFNPRSREGSDIDRNVCRCVYRISIHAPARGATDLGRSTSAGVMDFNPRSREGSDLTDRMFSTQQMTFQSTLPRGERRSGQVRDQAPHIRFQSTLPRGERHGV